MGGTNRRGGSCILDGIMTDDECRQRLGLGPQDTVEPATNADLHDPREDMLGRLVERPDGVHWIAEDGHKEFGPFASVEEALAAMSEAAEEEAPEPGETLAEAEQELGLSDWVDPDTGELAEDVSARVFDD